MSEMPVHKVEARAMLFWLVAWLDQERKLTDDDCIDQMEKSYEVIFNTGYSEGVKAGREQEGGR